MVKKLVVAAVVAVLPVLGVAAPAVAAPKKPGGIVTQAIDWH